MKNTRASRLCLTHVASTLSAATPMSASRSPANSVDRLVAASRLSEASALGEHTVEWRRLSVAHSASWSPASTRTDGPSVSFVITSRRSPTSLPPNTEAAASDARTRPKSIAKKFSLCLSTAPNGSTHARVASSIHSASGALFLPACGGGVTASPIALARPSAAALLRLADL